MYITTNQTDNKSNPDHNPNHTTKQHAVGYCSEHSTKYHDP